MSKKALVVDDEKVIVKGIKFSLEQDDIIVDCAYDGQEALDKARANEYDIILLDVMLPIMTGFEILEFYSNRKLYLLASVAGYFARRQAC